MGANDRNQENYGCSPRTIEASACSRNFAAGDTRLTCLGAARLWRDGNLQDTVTLIGEKIVGGLDLIE